MMMMQKLQQERLMRRDRRGRRDEQVLERHDRVHQGAQGVRQADLEFQNTQFKLVECSTKAQVGRAFVDEGVAGHVAGKLDVVTARRWRSSGRPTCSAQVIDDCLQFFGGYGYMLEYPIARLTDARVQRIYGGTNEIMKELIGRTL